MRAENERLSRDLAQTREILDKKAASSKIALNDIVENYRAAERARTEALREKETIAGELAALRFSWIVLKCLKYTFDVFGKERRSVILQLKELSVTFGFLASCAFA